MGAALKSEDNHQFASESVLKSRSIGFFLGLGILFLPYVFSWLTLRRGYSSLSRRIAFGWMCLLCWSIISTRSRLNEGAGKSKSQQMSAVEQKRSTPTIRKKYDFSKLVKTEDKMEDVRWYTSTEYGSAFNGPSHIAAYIGESKGQVSLKVMITYHADDWLFIKNYKFLVDGEKFESGPLIPEQRVESGDGVYEWTHTNASVENIALLKAIWKSKKATIRYSGTQFYRDRVISEREKRALGKVITAYYSNLDLKSAIGE